MDRRDFLKTAGLAAASLAVEGCASPLGRPERAHSAVRPNILFCITDDQSWVHAGAYGSKMVKTPAFDRLAHEGVLFTHAFVSAPSCCPSRGSILTGQAFYRLREGAQNHCLLDASFDVYPEILEQAGYYVGFTGKGWGPGDFKAGGRTRNPAGPEYNKIRTVPPTKSIDTSDYAANFDEFLKARPASKPFCFWYGSLEPHRTYEKGSALRLDKKLADAEVPPFLPDAKEVREDILDYAAEIDWSDTHLARMLKNLEDSGELDNTIIVATSDNGMPFPRAKATLYDYGTREPLAIRWGAKVKAGRVIDDFISFTDFAPTFLEAAGIEPTCEMTGRSFLPVLLASRSGQVDSSRDHVIIGRERHQPLAFANLDDSAPCRAIRTADYLYIRYYNPGAPIAGEEKPGYRDVDTGPTKTFMLQSENRDKYRELFELAFGPRPAEELFDVRKDPAQIHNVADDLRYADVKRKLSEQMNKELIKTKDPRTLGDVKHFSRHFVLTGEYKDVKK